SQRGAVGESTCGACVGLFLRGGGAGEDAAQECHRVLFVQREARVALSANRHDRQVMWTWFCQKALGRYVILVRFEARERPRAVDAPRHLPFIDKLLDLLHRLPRADGYPPYRKTTAPHAALSRASEAGEHGQSGRASL